MANQQEILVEMADTSYGYHPVVHPSDLIFVDMDGAIAIDLVPGRYRIERISTPEAMPESSPDITSL